MDGPVASPTACLKSRVQSMMVVQCAQRAVLQHAVCGWCCPRQLAARAHPTSSRLMRAAQQFWRPNMHAGQVRQQLFACSQLAGHAFICVCCCGKIVILRHDHGQYVHPASVWACSSCTWCSTGGSSFLCCTLQRVTSIEPVEGG